MPSQDLDTERVTVSTYVPAYQKQRWDEHADRLGMSQSEFVRTMVQAGRRLYSHNSDDVTAQGTQETDSKTGNDTFQDEILDMLSANTYTSWDEILGEVMGDMEERIAGALDELQQENRIQHSGPNDGYTLIE